MYIQLLDSKTCFRKVGLKFKDILKLRVEPKCQKFNVPNTGYTMKFIKSFQR